LLTARAIPVDLRRREDTGQGSLDQIRCGFIVCLETVEDLWQLADEPSGAFAELQIAATRTRSLP